MAYSKIHDKIFEDEFTCVTLRNEGLRYAFLALIVYAAKNRGCIFTDSPDIISRHIFADVSIVSEALDLAIKHGKIERTDRGLIITNYLTYHDDLKNADRQKRFREKKKLSTESNVTDNVTVTHGVTHRNAVTPNTKSNTNTNTNTKSKIPPNPLFEEVELWNSEAPKSGYAKVLLPLSQKRISAVKARRSEPNFNLSAILAKMASSTFLQGKNNRKWKATFDWVFCSTNNYQKILEGQFDPPPKTDEI